MIIQEPIQAAIWHCLNHYAYNDAVFLSERLYAEVKSDEALYLLATAYYRAGLRKYTYALLKNYPGATPQCRYLFACCAFELNRYSEAERALLGVDSHQRSLDDLITEFGDEASFALQILAKVCIKTERKTRAIEALRKALKLNPFLWTCFTELCKKGDNPDANRIFQLNTLDNLTSCHGGGIPNAAATTITMATSQLYGVDNATITPISNHHHSNQQQQQQHHHHYSSNSHYTSSSVHQPHHNYHYNSSSNNYNNTSSNIHHQTNHHHHHHNNNSNNNNNQHHYHYNNHHHNNNHHYNHLQQPNNFLINSGDHTTTTTPGSVLQSSVNTKLFTPDDSPLANPLALSGVAALPPTRLKPNHRYRNQQTTIVSPFTPSFGIIHWDGSPTVDTTNNYYGTPSATTLTEANDQKSLAKRVRAHVGQLINRKDSTIPINKPIVFSQSSNVTNNNNNSNNTNNNNSNSNSNNNNNNNNNSLSTSSSPAALSSLATQNVRRSSRLFSNSYSVKENNKSPNRNKFVTPKSPSRKNNKRITKTSNLGKNVYSELNARNRGDKERNETITSAENASTNNLNNAYNTGTNTNSTGGGGGGGGNHTNTNSLSSGGNNFINNSILIQKQCAEGLMQLMRILGTAYAHLTQYECTKTIECLNTVPPQHYDTVWVQSLLGVAYFEMANYECAAELFGQVHEREPHRLECMEIYSTALWHLQREVSLSALAQDLVKMHKHSPITWCVAGNCFSLHKEHDTAIKFFQRAVQVDPNFTYAYTLLGHEYVTTEELDKALNNFRLAISLDIRHYNAWFGIGTIYAKQERYQLAEMNYMRALKINPQSSVLMCHIGVVQNALKQPEKALHTLTTAINNDPKNPLCKFHRGQIYFNLGRHTEALKELEELKKIVPKESLVFYLIGKVHKKLGNTDLALMHFSWATDLDPKGASSQIKEAFDPSMTRPQTDDESSPQSPTPDADADVDADADGEGDDFPSESNSVPQQETSQEEMAFSGLPEDSDSDIL